MLPVTGELDGSTDLALMLAKLKGFISERSQKTYLVGGFVRDLLLGRPGKDMDLVVAGDALAVAASLAAALGGSYAVLDKEHGIARIYLKLEGPAEERWVLDIASLREEIRSDLAKRDFTVDAMALPLEALGNGREGDHIIDPFGGRKDLQRGVIRAVNPQVFKQDGARLLRAVRLAAELGFSLEPATEEQIRQDAHYITSISGERVRDELLGILACPGATLHLRLLDHLGLLARILPELETARGIEQPPEHFWDVFQHSLETVGAAEQVLEEPKIAGGAYPLTAHFAEEVVMGRTRLILLKLAALLHDIGKPATKSVEETGRIRFLGHAKLGANMSLPILERLRFSQREIRMVCTMIEHHLRPGQLLAGETITRRALYRYFRDTAPVAIDTLILNLADHLAMRGPLLNPREWSEHMEGANRLLHAYYQEREIALPPKLMDGHDLIELFDLEPGPEIGRLLEEVQEAQAEGLISTREEALIFLRQALGREPRRE